MIRCNKCRTDAVVVDGTYRCQCDIQRAFRLDSDEGNRLLQVVELLRERPAVCDSCKRTEAFKLVICSHGCSHAQCFDCAEQTKAERSLNT